MERNKLPLKNIKSGLKSDMMVDMIDYVLRAINDTDDNLAWERVTTLRKTRSQASEDELVKVLVRQKCLQAGAVGAITAGTALIPGGGMLITFTFGVAADLTLTFKMQAELVLEIAAVYGRRLRRSEKRQVVLLVTGMSAVGDQLISKGGAAVAKRATERLAAKSAEKALPVISIAASAGKNILTTYIVGQRAQAYFSLSQAEVDEWPESFKAITGLDFQRLVTWLADTSERSWQLFSQNLQNATAATIVAGQTGGEVIVVQADKMGRQVLQAGKSVADKAWSRGEATLNVGKNIGEGVAAGATVAGWIVEDTGQSILQGVKVIAGQTSTVTQRMVSALPHPQIARLVDRPADEVKTIFDLAEPSQRVAHVIAGCDTPQAAFSAFARYFAITLPFPLIATWRDPDETHHTKSITVLGVNSTAARRGVLFTIQYGAVQRRLLAEQVWLAEPNTVLDDYRYWLEGT